MRLLDDLSIFLQQKARLQYHAGAFSLYQSGENPDSVLVAQRSEVLEQLGIFCCYLGRSEIRDFYLQRRVKQNFLSLGIHLFRRILHPQRRPGISGGSRRSLSPASRNGSRPDVPVGKKNGRKMGMILYGWMLPDLLKLFQLDHVDVIHLPDSKRLDDLFDRIRDTLQNAVSHASCEQNAAYTFGLLQMLSNVSKTEPLPPEIARILEFFEAHCSEPLNIRRLASEWGMSLPTLNKRFRAAVHMTPYQYLLRLRLQRAAYLLQTDDWTIKEVAELAGYRNPLHFSSEFHRFHGCSPREFRKKLHSF